MIGARACRSELSTKLGQPVIVENKPGAGGTIGAAQVAKSAPDGYTLLVNSSGHTVNPSIYPNLTYDTAKDLMGVSLLAAQPNILVVSPDKGWKTADDLVKAAKAQPGKLTYRLGRRRQRHPHERREVQARAPASTPCTSPTRARPRR